MRALIIITSAIVVILGIGTIQNYFNNPVRGCQQFNTGTEYNGFKCKDKVLYTR